jgi:hypothetical protein
VYGVHALVSIGSAALADVGLGDGVVIGPMPSDRS